MKTVAKWTGAIVLSLAAHAGVAGWLSQSAPVEEQIAGGEATEITLLGNAFEDTIEAGDPSEAVDPLEAPVEEIQPTETVPAETVTEEISPVTEEVPMETAEAIQPTTADIAVPLEDLPLSTTEEPMVTAALQSAEEIKPIEEPEPKPVEKKIVKKVEPKKKPEPKKTVEKKPERKKVVRKTAGAGGESVQRQKKGVADGSEQATSSNSKGKKGLFARQAGNAAVSNYPGKIRSKLNRAMSARRDGLRGTVTVSFTVSSGGGLSGVRIARSSGFPELDQSALATVRRAAPFPKIPEGAGKSSWAFTVPIAYSR